MTDKNRAIAESFYQAMSEKNLSGIKKYLDKDVDFSSPLTASQGIDAMLEAVVKFMSLFESLHIRAVGSAQGQPMVIYDANFPSLIGKCRTAALLNINNGLISRVELFFDTRPFTPN